MKKIFLVFFIMMTNYCYCQTKKADDAPKSLLESFSEKSGSLIKKEFIDIGKINRIKVQILILTDVVNNTTESGLRLEGTTFDGNTKIAFLDQDELDGFIKSLNYIINNVLNAAPPDNDIEYNFNNRSNFRAGIFNNKKKWTGFLKLDIYDGYSQFDFSTDDFQKFKELVEQAKSKM